jgi:Tat protein secretion system quality control protein TatD with DNase activity
MTAPCGVPVGVQVVTPYLHDRSAVALAEQWPDVYATVGIHPHDAAEATDADFSLISERGETPFFTWGSASQALLPLCPCPAKNASRLRYL